MLFFVYVILVECEIQHSLCKLFKLILSLTQIIMLLMVCLVMHSRLNFNHLLYLKHQASRMVNTK